MCNHETNVLPDYHHSGFVATHALRDTMYTHDVPSHIPSAWVATLPQCHCGDNWEGILLSRLHTYIYIYIYIANALARSRIDTYCNTALLSIKNTLCETKIIIFSKSYWKLGKMNARFWKNIWNKGKIMLDIFKILLT